jgi:hypothetical protein
VETSSGQLSGPLFERIPSRARPALLRILAGIEPDTTGPDRAFLGAPSWRIPLPWGSPLSPWEAQFVLGDIIGCPDFGQDEKLAWEFPLLFEGLPMTLAFEKFGLRAYVATEVAEATAADAAQRMAERIAHSIPLLKKTVLTEIADEQITLGLVNVENRYGPLHRQYLHFKKLSEASLAAAADAKRITEELPDGSIVSRNPAYYLREQARFEGNAAVHGLFSLLEHLLLIEFFLAGKDATNDQLATFIGSGWIEKFKQVVSLGDPETKRQYDRLVALHDELRNPSAHGEVEADGTDFKFLLPGVGPIATRLVIEKGKKRSYRWPAGGVGDILAELTEIEQWLAVGRLARAVQYGESDLDLYFGSDIGTAIGASSDDPDELARAIESVTRMVDNAANMDW